MTHTKVFPLGSFIRIPIRLILRCNPFYRGGHRLAALGFLRALIPKDRLLILHLRRGVYCLVRANEWCGPIMYYTGDYDRRITWICRRLLRPGDCFLDIGANYGEVGLYAAQFVGSSGQVHAFEPQPKLANLIRVSAELNGFEHFHTHQIALSDRDGQANFFVPRRHTGMGSLSPGSTDREKEVDVLDVCMRRTENYLEHLRLPRIRLIKLDVEGHEEQVMHGAMYFLQSNKPAAIIFESHDDGQPFFERGVVRVILSLGYELFQLRQKIWLRVQLRKLDSSDMLESGFDFIALSTSPEHKDVHRLLGID